jgi:type I restriction enzyme S subunit
MSTTKRKKQLRVAEASASYLVQPQQARHSGESRNPVPLVRLAEVAEINPRRFSTQPDDDELVSFIPMKAVEEETGRLDASEIRPWREVKKGYTPFQDGDVIFAKITPCMENGKFAMAKGLHDGRAAGSTEFHVFRPGLMVDSEYLLHFLFMPELRSNAKLKMQGAAGQLRVTTNFFNDIEIPLPAINKQRQIVAELEKQFTRLEAGIAASRRVQVNLKRYRAAVLKAAYEGRLVPIEAELARQSHRAYKAATELLATIHGKRHRAAIEIAKQAAHEPSYTNNLPGLPVGWAWSSLGECFTISVGATPSRKEPSYWNGDIPWVSSGEVQFGRVTGTREKITAAGLQNSSTKLNPVRSVLLAMIGQGRTRGQAALLDIAAANNQNCAAIWVGQTPIAPEYVYYWLMGRYEETRTRGSGNNQQALNKRLVEQIPIPLAPLVEQRRIINEVERHLSVIEELESAASTNLKRANRLRQSILQKAFTGNL